MILSWGGLIKALQVCWNTCFCYTVLIIKMICNPISLVRIREQWLIMGGVSILFTALWGGDYFCLQCIVTKCHLSEVFPFFWWWFLQSSVVPPCLEKYAVQRNCHSKYTFSQQWLNNMTDISVFMDSQWQTGKYIRIWWHFYNVGYQSWWDRSHDGQFVMYYQLYDIVLLFVFNIIYLSYKVLIMCWHMLQVTVELVKLLVSVPIEHYQNAFLNLALPVLLFSEPAPAERITLS